MDRKVAVIMGSDSDMPIVSKCLNTLKNFGIPYDVRVMSAHRTPLLAMEYATNAESNGIGVIIAAAGKAAHLPGVLAAYTSLPVIGLPIKGSALDGLDALLSIVQMPAGVPVATVAIDGAENAAILAAQILALGDAAIAEKLSQHKETMKQNVENMNNKIGGNS